MGILKDFKQRNNKIRIVLLDHSGCNGQLYQQCILEQVTLFLSTSFASSVRVADNAGLAGYVWGGNEVMYIIFMVYCLIQNRVSEHFIPFLLQSW